MLIDLFVIILNHIIYRFCEARDNIIALFVEILYCVKFLINFYVTNTISVANKLLFTFSRIFYKLTYLMYINHGPEYWHRQCCDLHLQSNFSVPFHGIVDVFLILWLQSALILVLSIWARASGPRFRPDQLFTVTWKDLMIALSGHFLFLSLLIFYFF